MTAPARSEQRRRTEQVLVRLDKAELAALDALCEQYNLTRAEAFRATLVMAGIVETASSS